MHLMSLKGLVPTYISHFDAYIPSKPDPELKKLYGCQRLYRLNNNENCLGPPPEAREIIERFPPPAAALYPSGDCYYLRNTLAERFGKHPNQFIVGNGANDVISCVIKAFCQEGDNIVTADRTYSLYEWVAQYSGFEARLVPLRNLTFDAEGILQRIDRRTKVIFVCNPNNPTGTYWDIEKLRRFLDAVGERHIVVVDEAYAEFVEQDDYPDGMALMKRYPNLIVFRTFSKMYGLAGLRIGYLAGTQEVVQTVRKVWTAYSVNSVAQQAAEAAIQSRGHIQRTRRLMSESKGWLKREISRLNLPFIAGEGNFVMVRLPMSDTLAFRRLMREGFMVRPMTEFRFPNHIRISISHLEVMEAFLEALKKILQ